MRKSVVPGSSWDTESIEILSIFYRKRVIKLTLIFSAESPLCRKCLVNLLVPTDLVRCIQAES